jgi:hypothetical protein
MSSIKPNAVMINPNDNVVTLLQNVRARESIRWTGGEPLPANQDVPAGHKVAVMPLAPGDVILKYGHPIGSAGEAIAPGDHVHIHNLTEVES